VLDVCSFLWYTEFNTPKAECVSIIFLPDSDPALREANLALGAEREHEGATVTYIRIEMVPQLRTIFVPRLNIEPAFA